MKQWLTTYWISALGLLCLAALFFFPAIPQPTEYHNFADNRHFCGTPNFHNVWSNAPFLLIGLWGMIRRKAWKEKLLFLGIFGIGLGSGYYHYSPSNETLLWDRLPMTIVFTTFYGMVVSDFKSRSEGTWLFQVLLPFGIFSVVYWHFSELFGAGDLRWYGFIQFFPMLTIPFLLIFYRNRDLSKGLLLVIAAYGGAKVLEATDQQIFDAIGYSGHATKHLFAAIATGLMYPYCVNRSAS